MKILASSTQPASALPAKRDASASEQAAALALRDIGGVRQVMLVTSRDTGRWVIPKGWVEPGETGRATAEREAAEEAGLSGTVSREPLGTFTYRKVRPRRGDKTCRVTVYRMDEVRENPDWPEKNQRLRRWFPVDEAAALVDEPDLGFLISGLARPQAAE